jgi:hypothetical protein
MMLPLRPGWSPFVEQRSDPKGRQIKCLTADEGHVWIHSYDLLPPAVRHRLATSPFNLCAACIDIEAKRVSRRRRGGRRSEPSVGVYFAVIAAIEEELAQGDKPGDDLK